MYRELVGSLNLGCIPGVKFWSYWMQPTGEGTWRKIPCPDEELVEDVGQPLMNLGNPFQPHWGIHGHFNEMIQGGPEFFIDPEGPHILFITCIPQGSEARDYYLNETYWRSCWEDTKHRYLFQLTAKH